MTVSEGWGVSKGGCPSLNLMVVGADDSFYYAHQLPFSFALSFLSFHTHVCIYIYIYIYIRGCLDSLENQQRYLSLHVGNIKGCDDVFRVSQALGMSVSWQGNPDGLCDGTFCALFHKQLWLQP